MRKRWYALLAFLTLASLTVILGFIGYQYRPKKTKYRFALSEDEWHRENSKEIRALKAQIMVSIAKSSMGNLKGPLPSSVEFDVSNKDVADTKSWTKVFNVAYMQVPGVEGYTHIFKEKLPVSRFTDKGVEQTGLPVDTPLEAALTYFKEGESSLPPLVVCLVTTIESQKFQCYLTRFDNSWTIADSINNLDPDDNDFAAKVAQEIKSYYEIFMPAAGSEGDSNSDAEPLELNISKRESNPEDVVKVQKLDKNGPEGFSAFFHNTMRNSIAKYTNGYVDQTGLLTGTQLDAVVTFFNDQYSEELPLAVCCVVSAQQNKMECYLMESFNTWSKNDELSSLDSSDPEYGEKAGNIISTHYSALLYAS